MPIVINLVAAAILGAVCWFCDAPVRFAYSSGVIVGTLVIWAHVACGNAPDWSRKRR